MTPPCPRAQRMDNPFPPQCPSSPPTKRSPSALGGVPLDQRLKKGRSVTLSPVMPGSPSGCSTQPGSSPEAAEGESRLPTAVCPALLEKVRGLGETERVCEKTGCSHSRVKETGQAGKGHSWAPLTDQSLASCAAITCSVPIPDIWCSAWSGWWRAPLGSCAPECFSTYGRLLSGCVWCGSAAVTARWLGRDRDVVWSQQNHCRFLTEVAVV